MSHYFVCESSVKAFSTHVFSLCLILVFSNRSIHFEEKTQGADACTCTRVCMTSFWCNTENLKIRLNIADNHLIREASSEMKGGFQWNEVRLLVKWSETSSEMNIDGNESQFHSYYSWDYQLKEIIKCNIFKSNICV